MALTSQTLALGLGTVLAENASSCVKIDALLNDDFSLEVCLIPNQLHFGVDAPHWVQFVFSQATRLFAKLEQRVGLRKQPEDNRIFGASLTWNRGSTYTLIVDTSFGSVQYDVDVQYRFSRRSRTPEMAHDLFNIGIKFHSLRDTLTVYDEPDNDNSLCNVLSREVMKCITPAPSDMLLKVWLEPSLFCFDGDGDRHEAGFGESILRPGNLCAFKASWLVATRRKGRRLVDRLPGRLLLHRRRYNWDDSEDCDNGL
jgi:hypothetical protein